MQDCLKQAWVARPGLAPGLFGLGASSFGTDSSTWPNGKDSGILKDTPLIFYHHSKTTYKSLYVTIRIILQILFEALLPNG